MNFTDLFNLKGKAAIVTGGAISMGKATAYCWRKLALISIGNYNLDDACTTVSDIARLGVKAIAISCDVLKDQDLVNLVEETVR